MNQTVHLMKYIFPRQFGLHNVFTSRVDPMETTQVFKDYTLREHEISLQEESLRLKTKRPQNIENRIPKRLRGETLRLVQELQKRSSRCSFEMLLRYYCPVPKRDSVMLSSSQKVNGRSNKRVKIRPTSAQEIHDTARTARSLESDPSLHALEDDGKDRQLAYSSPSITDMANSHAEISAFCRSVMSKLIPNKFWGSSYEGENKREIMKSVDRFIALRRFESLSLHAVFQHIKVCPKCFRIQLLSNRALDSSCTVACPTAMPRAEDLYFRLPKEKRHIPGICLLHLRLYLNSLAQIQFSRDRIQCSSKQAPVFPT